MPQAASQSSSLRPQPPHGYTLDAATQQAAGVPQGYTLDAMDSAPKGPTSLNAAPKAFTLPWFKQELTNFEEGATKNLPAIGGTAGALIGGAGGGPLAPISATGGAGIGGMAGEAGKQLIRRWLGFGDAPQTSGDAASNITKQGAVQGGVQGLTEGLGAGARALAPKFAESALGITERMRGRGRTIGESVINETSGVRPKTIAQQSKSQLGNLTKQMENSVDQATQQGAMGTTQPAHDVLNDAITKVPRNARNLQAKLQGLRDLLTLNPQSPTLNHTPNELLEMKRGIDKEISTWPPEWQKMSDVQQVKQRLYGAIDGEIDRLVPGNAEMNQRISSLIPAKQQAQKLSNSAPFTQKLAHRAAAHTGALAGSGIGGFLGSQSGDTPEQRRQNALLGAAAGFIGPELLTTPTAQMIGARTLNAAPNAAPYVLPFLRVAASQQANDDQNRKLKK